MIIITRVFINKCALKPDRKRSPPLPIPEQGWTKQPWRRYLIHSFQQGGGKSVHDVLNVITYGITKLHEEYINMQSAIEKGTTFKTRLPLAEAGAETTKER